MVVASLKTLHKKYEGKSVTWQNYRETMKYDVPCLKEKVFPQNT